MKWEKRLSLSRVFPISWLSKLRQPPGKSPPSSQPSKTKQRARPRSPQRSSLPVCFRPARFSESGRHVCSISNLSFSPEILDKRTGKYVAGFVEPEDDFWRFSFRKQSFECKDGGVASESRGSACRRSRNSGYDGSRRVDPRLMETVSLPGTADSSRENQHLHRIPPPHASAAGIDSFPPLTLKRRPPRTGKPKDMTPEEHRRKAKPRGAGKAELFSPRTICRIRALDEARRRKDRRGRGRGREFESFAVVKRSEDPQRDFRESMVEMISEKKIGRAEELESLLACYLALNSDEFHDVIVKVFRQVWFDLNRDCFVSDSDRGYYDY